MSATVGRLARRNDSVFPAQSWNSSQTSTGRSVSPIAVAIFLPTVFGSARAVAITEQNPRKFLRETPRRSSSSRNQFSLTGSVMSPPLYSQATDGSGGTHDLVASNRRGLRRRRGNDTPPRERRKEADLVSPGDRG